MPRFEYKLDTISGKISQYISEIDHTPFIGIPPGLNGAYDYSTDLVTTVSEEGERYYIPGGDSVILDDPRKMSDQAFMWFYLGNTIRTKSIKLKRTASHGVKNERARIWIFDNLLFNIDLAEDYGDIVNELWDLRSNTKLVYSKSFNGDNDPDSSAHDINTFTNIYKIPLTKSEDIHGTGNDDADPEVMFSSDMNLWSESILNNSIGDSFYILVEIRADNSTTNKSRKRSAYVFSLPKILYWELMQDYSETGKGKYIIYWGTQSDAPNNVDRRYDIPGNAIQVGNYDSGKAYNVKGFTLEIEVNRSGGVGLPVIDPTDMENFPEQSKTVPQWPLYVDLRDAYTFENNFSPNKPIDYITLMIPGQSFTNDHRVDFRPVSDVYVTYGEDYSAQSYYEEDTDGSLAVTSLNEVKLSFNILTEGADTVSITQQDEGAETVYVDVAHPESYALTEGSFYTSGDFKFRVVQWGDEPYLLEDWELIQNYDNISLDEYPYYEVFNEEANHIYIEGGIHNIKAFVFSYITHPDDDQLAQALRWKLVTIKIYLSSPSHEVEDFSTLGGYDFTILPWPETVPVISGVSNSSNYKKSLDIIIQSGKFSDDEANDFSKLKDANENDELGEYLGETNIEQVRVFTDGSYDIDTLMETNDEIVEGLYIDDILDPQFKNNCILELNLGDIDNDIIYDSAGGGNKGVLIGDYLLEKTDKDVPIRRTSSMRTSIAGTDTPAL